MPIMSADTRRANLALFLAGFITFGLLYDVQPLLPLITRDYGLHASAGAWVMSLSTLGMALAIMAVNVLAAHLPRRSVMLSCLLLASSLSLLMAVLPSFASLLGLRMLIGLALGSVPVLAMAVLSDRIAGERLGHAMGLYISGTALGGMAGRLVASLLVARQGWQHTVFFLGCAGLACSLLFWWALPAAPGAAPPAWRRSWRDHLRIWKRLGQQAPLRRYDAIGLLLMSCFVTAYNGVAYHLLSTPSAAGSRQLGALYIVYLVGAAASNLAGRAADRYGYRRALMSALGLLSAGLVLALYPGMIALVIAMALITFGFFAGHAVASAAVGGISRPYAGHAAALYLLCYYGGSSIVGALGGVVWDIGGWPYVLVFLLVLSLIALLLAGASAERPQALSFPSEEEC